MLLPNRRRASRPRSLVMRPHPLDEDSFRRLVDAVDETMLDVDAAGVVARQVAHQLFVWWRRAEWILLQEIQQAIDLVAQAGPLDLDRVLLGVFAEVERPAHQGRFREYADSGARLPSTNERLIPGTPIKYSVSCMAR